MSESETLNYISEAISAVVKENASAVIEIEQVGAIATCKITINPKKPIDTNAIIDAAVAKSIHEVGQRLNFGTLGR